MEAMDSSSAALISKAEDKVKGKDKEIDSDNCTVSSGIARSDDPEVHGRRARRERRR